MGFIQMAGEFSAQPELRYNLRSDSREKTFDLGFQLGKLLFPPAVIALSGPLGGGKTCFIQGMAKGLKVRGPVTSPTYTMVNLYEDGSVPFYHCDCYRLLDSGDPENIGFEEIFSRKAVVALEWAEAVEEFLPDEYLKVIFNYINEHSRSIGFYPLGTGYRKLVSGLPGLTGKK